MIRPRNLIITCSAAATSCTFGVAMPSYAEQPQLVASAGVSATPAMPANSPVSSNAESCSQLKAELQSAGSLMIVSGGARWGDTFYGPQVPQCQFWTNAKFTYVPTSDGLCGVGYVCAQRYGA